MRELAETAGAVEPNVFARVITGLAEPVRRLDNLAALADPALAGDEHARCELQAALAAVRSRLGPDLAEPLEPALAGDCGCGPSSVLEPPQGEEREAVVDQPALAALVVAVAVLYKGEGSAERRQAIDAVFALAIETGSLGALSAAFQRGGRDELLRAVDGLDASGRLAWFSPSLKPMTLRSTPAPAPAGFGLGGVGFELEGGGPEGLPTLPGGVPKPGLPHGPDDAPPGLGGIVGDLLGQLRKKRKWDPDDWDPRYRWWRDPIEYIDPRELARIRCLLELRRLLYQLDLVPPPVHLGRVTWSDGITRISQSGACAGDTITIRGKGFGATQPSDVVVLVPTSDGCRPVAVDSWTDTAITVTLPNDVTSGPVGFGNGAYIKAYDDWVKRENEIADEIRRLWCARSVPDLLEPFGECPPETAFNRLHAGPARIKSFTANWAAVAAVQPADPITLRWTVENADHVRVDRVSGAGPTFGGPTSLVDPVGNTYTLAPPGNTGPATYAYRLTATGPCGTATADVTVVAVKRPRLRIAGLEVTQSIQTPTSSVRLVRYKPTVVRVTITHALAGWGPNVVANVTGRIRTHRGGIVSPWFDPANGSSPMAPTPGASITVLPNPQRNQTNDTLNFLIPPAWCTGTVWFEVEVRLAGFGANSAAGFAGYSELLTTNSSLFTFEQRRTLELRYIRVKWGTTAAPTGQVCFDTLRTAVPLLPTPTANISALAGVGVQNSGGTADSDRDTLIDDFDDRHNCSWWEALWEWLGADCPDDDGAIWVLIPNTFERGKAKDIPSNTCFTPPNDGPYAAHELSHCLDQKHVGVMCSNGQQAQGGDPPSAFPNNAQLTDVPFDVTRNVALSLVGTGVFDVMSYCGTPNNTWPMPVRWQRLWDQIGS